MRHQVLVAPKGLNRRDVGKSAASHDWRDQALLARAGYRGLTLLAPAAGVHTSVGSYISQRVQMETLHSARCELALSNLDQFYQT